MSTLADWSRSEVEYGRKVISSGLDGVRSGRDAFLGKQSIFPFVSKSVSTAVKTAALGACVGILGSYPGDQRGWARRALRLGLLGGLVGLVAGVVWESRLLMANAAKRALENINTVRKEHWLEKHPIDYA